MTPLFILSMLGLLALTLGGLWLASHAFGKPEQDCPRGESKPFTEARSTEQRAADLTLEN